VREGSKLRARVVSDGYDPNFNMRFPRDIREDGILYVVDEVIEGAGGGSYIVSGVPKTAVPPCSVTPYGRRRCCVEQRGSVGSMRTVAVRRIILSPGAGSDQNGMIR